MAPRTSPESFFSYALLIFRKNRFRFGHEKQKKAHFSVKTRLRESVFRSKKSKQNTTRLDRENGRRGSGPRRSRENVTPCAPAHILMYSRNKAQHVHTSKH